MKVSLSERIGFIQLPGKYGCLTATNRGPIDINIDELDTVGKNAIVNKIKNRVLIVNNDEETARELKKLEVFYKTTINPNIIYKPSDIKPLTSEPVNQFQEKIEELHRRMAVLLRAKVDIVLKKAKSLKPHEIEVLIIEEERRGNRKSLLTGLKELLTIMSKTIPVKQQLSETDKKELQKSIDFMSRREIGATYSKLISPIVEEEEETVIINYNQAPSGD
jgi:hypothetical protein